MIYRKGEERVMKNVKITDLLLFVIITELAGAVSGILSGGGFGAYYDTLVKPPLAPPGWVFPVVWGVLYALMGVSAYIINASDAPAKRQAIDLYWLQLLANVLWSPAFFGLRSFGTAVAVVTIMIVLILLMLAVFMRIDKCAVWLSVPYLAWTLFAAYLTIGFYALNNG